MAVYLDSHISYEDFSCAMISILENKLEGKKKLKIEKIRKNNSTEKDGIMIASPEAEISPTFYMEDLYSAAVNGTSIDELAENLFPYYAKDYDIMSFNDLHFDDFELIKDKIVFKLINTDYNRELLTITPHLPFLDLSIVFMVLTLSPNGDIGAILIPENQLKTWNVDTPDLYELALKNTREILGVKIEEMSSLLINMVSKSFDDDASLNESEKDALINDIKENGNRSEIYVMTNNSGTNGASVILTDNLKIFADQIENDLYIVPSSIHEVLLIPYNEDISKESLSAIIKNVNETELALTDVLSDHLYFYSRKEKIIKML